MDFLWIKNDYERWRTALILFVAVCLVGFFHSIWVIGIFLTIVYMAALFEAISLFKVQKPKLIYALALLFWIAALFYPRPVELLFLALIIAASFSAYSERADLKNALPFLYPTAPMLFLFSLYAEFGILSYVWLLAIVIACDAAAFFAGKGLGKTPFCPTSPNKTIEGVAGGITAGTIIGTLAGLPIVAGFWSVLAISFLASVASVFGDLFESFLKRKAGVKDSGTMLPGHGGVLDRIDSYLFAAVIMLMGLHAIA
ncbi:MAG: phosphatidate cytidylyltransferase [Helicobacteraceae bacterium]|jgi:phosphatidate cytidylyltransferase|nr:phosphatidate cytidylyltransferase [Helicobacteraceae bacterium]